MAFLNWPVNRPKLTSHGQALPTDCSGRAFEVNGPSFRHTSVRGVRFFSRYPCGMPARGSITGQVRPKRRSAPYPFILEALAPLEPEVRPMFSGFAVYVGEKIVLMLRDSPKQPEDNGVWLVSSVTANLADPGIRKDFPSIRLIKLWAARSPTGGSSRQTARPLSRKHCTPASSCSNTTSGSDVSRSLGRPAQPSSVASDCPRLARRIAKAISACHESFLVIRLLLRTFQTRLKI
jgi:hypothetical protein